MLEELAQIKGVTVEVIFKNACGHYNDQGLTINPDKAWRYYEQTGYIPFFVIEYCKEKLSGIK